MPGIACKVSGTGGGGQRYVSLSVYPPSEPHHTYHFFIHTHECRVSNRSMWRRLYRRISSGGTILTGPLDAVFLSHWNFHLNCVGALIHTVLLRSRVVTRAESFSFLVCCQYLCPGRITLFEKPYSCQSLCCGIGIGNIAYCVAWPSWLSLTLCLHCLCAAGRDACCVRGSNTHCCWPPYQPSPFDRRAFDQRSPKGEGVLRVVLTCFLCNKK